MCVDGVGQTQRPGEDRRPVDRRDAWLAKGEADLWEPTISDGLGS
jgi:hypothetical protein